MKVMHNDYIPSLEENLTLPRISTTWNTLFTDYLVPWKISQAEESSNYGSKF